MTASWPRAACLLLLALVPRWAGAQPQAVTGPPPPSAPPSAAPITPVGSFGPDVYLEDITYTVRQAYIYGLTVSRTDPDVAYAGSWDGYIFKTTDGGKTWDEFRLITQAFPFYGDSGERLYFGRHRTAGGPDSQADLSMPNRLSNGLTSLTQVGGVSPIRPSRPGADVTVGPAETSTKLEQRLAKRKGVSQASSGGLFSGDSGGGTRAGASANVNFGIGLPGGAPRLQLLVRKFLKPTSGLNLQQTLLLRGTRLTEVRHLVIHPQNPKVVFACTAYGLYKTYDGGSNWVRTFVGTRPKGRYVFHVAIDPQNPQKVLMATAEGLYLSSDGGESWMKSTKGGVGGGVINWIYFNPYDPRYVYAGTNFGLLRSPDGGENWNWIYFTTFPTARVVRHVIIDPFDQKTGYIATHDGLYTTPDLLSGGLESWSRLGGLQFTGNVTTKITACPKHKGHLWTLTNMQLPSVVYPGNYDTGGAFIWESLDGGKRWNVIYAGHTNGSMQWFDSDPTDPDLLWIAWSRALSRMRRVKPTKIQRARRPIPDDPPIPEVMMAAMRYTGLDPSLQLEYRARSRLKVLMPSIQASYRQWRWHDYPLLHSGLYPMLPFRGRTLLNDTFKEFQVMAIWDLSPLIFDLEQTLFGRVDRISGEMRGWVTHEVHRFYGELRRLRAMMATTPPEDMRLRLIYKERIKVLTALMDNLTGGYLTRWKRGDRPSGMGAKWWERWPTGENKDH